MILQRFIIINQNRPDDIGKMCQTILKKDLVNFSLPMYSQMTSLTAQRGIEFSYETVDKFFKLYKAQRFESVFN